MAGRNMNVVVVESPAKAKTINKYLGPDYKVLASFGHVRDLPAKDGSVRPDEDFDMSWEVDSASAKRLNEIAEAVKKADSLILATDPDREGEAISWHVLDVLKKKKAIGDKPVKRVVFNAITKKAVLDAMAEPRDIDAPLVNAYLARRALDYLVGFNLSPVLWRKLPGARSAGRVQSVALRLVCDREAEIERFVAEEYWNISALLRTPRNDVFEARLVSADGKRLQKTSVGNAEQANDLKSMLEGAAYRVDSVEAKPVKRNPAPPFTTSTLQQAASSRLGFSASRTMQVAQKLYEGLDIGGEVAGLITYMRTDGVQMAPEAIDAARRAIGQQFGDRYLPEKPRFYSTKAKNAQEAHEAIRPTDFNRTPDSVRRYLDADQFKLYDLIWKRGIASQMASADIERTTVEISATNGDRKAGFRAVGSVIKFDGFIAAYTDQREELEDQASGDEEDGRLPEIRAQETLAREKINASQHFTEPPPRYTEATLIKKMEELGIGRPSTYASTLATLRDRGYVTIDKRKLIPDSKGRIVTAFLEHFFTRYVEYDFTASLEEKLDSISAGDLNWKDVLRDFWKDFFAQIEQTKELKVSDIIDAMNDALAPLLFPPRADGGDPRVCQVCGTGRLSLKLGRYGAFIGCSNYPDCNFTRQLSSEAADEGSVSNEPVSFGTDPLTGEEVTLRSGRFGPYVQRGDGKTAKRASLPKGWRPDMMDLEKALALLNLPRDIGAHPETGKMISAGIGRYGPFVLHDGVYANLESVEDVFSIGLNRAVAVLADKASKSAGGSRGARAAASALKELGDHPDGGKVTVRDGRYGPYVNWGKVNATLPKGKDPQSVTSEEALALIAERAAKSPVKSKSTAKKKSAAADTGETKTKAASKPKAAAKSKAGAKTKKA